MARTKKAPSRKRHLAGKVKKCKETKAGSCSCGKKFRWWWRHRHCCEKCGRVICRSCLLKTEMPAHVKRFDVSQYEVCSRCHPQIRKEMRQNGLHTAVNYYWQGHTDGRDDGRHGAENRTRTASALALMKRQYRTYYTKGYDIGLREGRQEREDEEKRKHEELAAGLRRLNQNLERRKSV